MPNLTVDPQPEPSDLSNSVPVNPSPHNFPKSILTGILIFVLLSLTAYGAYWYGQTVATTKVTPSTSTSTEKVSSFSNVPTPKPVPVVIDETADWKTYMNTKLGYYFKYPIEWTTCPNDFGGGQTDTVVYLCSARLQPLDYIWTSFMDNPQNLNFQQLITQGLSDIIKDKFKYVTLTLGQNAAYKTRSLPGGSEAESVFFKMPNNGYIGISYQPSNPGSGFSEISTSYKTFQQILSTFKFL